MLPPIRWHFCLHFIKHYWSATRIDVLHSPFIYDLYNACIRRYDPSDYASVVALEKSLRKNQTMVEQVDFGKGEPVIKQKTIGELAKLQAKPGRITLILAAMIRYFRYRKCLELGTSLGISACYQGSAIRKISAEPGNPHPGTLTTIEGSEEIAHIARENIRKLDLGDYVQCITGNFDEVLPDILKQKDALDYVFIDGNHRYEPTISYFNQLLEKMHNGSVIVFDDIYWSREMTKAWNEIIRHPRVTVTVDLFFIGLVFFRKEQAREHFRLRIL